MSEPKWARRKDARPAEIIEAALGVFVEKGFANTRLDDVAKLAGVAKGTLYRYFESKDDLFRSVVQQAIEANLQAVEQAAKISEGSLADLVPVLLKRAADQSPDHRLPALARMVVSESAAFPELAQIWHDNVVARALALLTGLVANAQARGEIRAGDPGLHAFSIVGPLVSARLFLEVFGRSSPYSPDLMALAEQHAETVLRGLAIGSHARSGRRPA